MENSNHARPADAGCAFVRVRIAVMKSLIIFIVAVSAASAESNAAIAQAAVVAAAVAAAVAKEQADQSQREISHGHMTLMLTQMFGFLIVVVTLLAKAWTDERKHQWEQTKTEEHQTKVLAKLDKVNDSADAAYKEANTVNLKLVDIGVKMRDDKPLSPGEKGAT
jgi:multidrug efflux pump subunit AcrA (membrane-fusion protein)